MSVKMDLARPLHPPPPPVSLPPKARKVFCVHMGGRGGGVEPLLFYHTDKVNEFEVWAKKKR